MKYIIFVFIVYISLFLLFSCSNNRTSEKHQSQEGALMMDNGLKESLAESEDLKDLPPISEDSCYFTKFDIFSNRKDDLPYSCRELTRDEYIDTILISPYYDESGKFLYIIDSSTMYYNVAHYRLDSFSVKHKFPSPALRDRGGKIDEEVEINGVKFSLNKLLSKYMNVDEQFLFIDVASVISYGSNQVLCLKFNDGVGSVTGFTYYLLFNIKNNNISLFNKSKCLTTNSFPTTFIDDFTKSGNLEYILLSPQNDRLELYNLESGNLIGHVGVSYGQVGSGKFAPLYVKMKKNKTFKCGPKGFLYKADIAYENNYRHM